MVFCVKRWVCVRLCYPASVGRRDALLPVSILAWPLLGAGCAVATLIRFSVALLKQR